MDAVGKFPQFPKHLAGLILQIGELVGRELIAAEPIAGQTKSSDECHHFLLDSVMQIALDPTPLRVLRGNETDPRG
jgi:hypothetical protein